MGLIGKDDILAAQDIKTEDVDVPEWGGAVRVRVLSAADLLGFWEACRDEKGELVRSRVQPALLVRAVVGEDGAPIFSEENIGALMAKSATAIGRIFSCARRLNGIGQEDEATKNSAAAPSGDSRSASV